MVRSIQIGDLVELRAAHKIKRLRSAWSHTGVVTDIYVPEKGKNAGQQLVKVFFSVLTEVTYSGYALKEYQANKTLKILLKRLKKVR